MKILHIVPTYQPAFRRGGPILSVHNLNKWLVKKGADVTVYTTDIDINRKAPLGGELRDIDGVKVYYFPASFPKIQEYAKVFFLPAFLPRHWEYSKDLHNALAQNAKNFDLIHITSIFLFASTLGAYYAQKFNKPFIISPRGNLMEPMELKSALKKKTYMLLMENRNLKAANAIHFTVEREKEEYLRHAPPYKKAVTIPNGFDPTEFQSYEVKPHKVDFRERFGIAKNKKIVLFLSRLSWKKGLDTLIPAFAEVIKKEPRAILILAGSDDEGYKKDIDKWIKDCSLEKNIIFTGLLLGDDKIGVLQESDVFVLPSYSENFGMAVVEAMYFGLPIIITKEVGISPSVEKAQAGLVIEKDEKQLAEAILKILNNPNLAKEMGAAGKKLVETEFSCSSVAEKFIRAYNGLINQ